MNIYISGISGTGMGPLALMAKAAGHEVFGSDLSAGAVTDELKENDIIFNIGTQDGSFLEKTLEKNPIDWFIYTSALPKDHPELLIAEKNNIKTSKRDEFINYLITELNLKLIAIAGTHGKTTTTSMIIWCCQQLQIPISYIVGTTLPFSKSGAYDPTSQFFIYEADEYDRNFLHFHPYIAAITIATYDHSDIYPAKEDYQSAFRQFENQSETILKGGEIDNRITLAGEARKLDATLALKTIKRLKPTIPEEKIIETLNNFPGAGRRFERIADGIYSDYGHHPEEIAATIKIAQEEATRKNKREVIAIYEPHQNTRQHSLINDYKTVFEGVSHLFWLPTFLTREDPNLPILQPEDFIKTLTNKSLAEPANLNEKLAEKLKQYQKENYLILLLTAGPADTWLRNVFKD